MLWAIFLVVIVVMLVVDLGIFHRKTHVVYLREALIWSVIWIGLGLAFAVLVWVNMGPVKALEYLTGFVIEKSLSVDNLFVFLIIFSYFQVPRYLEHTVLFWGVLGVLVMRGIFIALGITLIHQFHWVLYIFGGFLIFTGIKLAFEKGKEIHPEHNPILKLFRYIMPVTANYEGNKFFLRINGRLYATPLFVVLLMVESTDVIFAVDSVPAVLAITHDPFIVYTSNIFAILGLRSLFFALSGIMRLFHHLHYGLAFILTFVGVKMLISDFYKIPVGYALLVVTITLVLSIIASVIWPPKHQRSPANQE